MKTLYRFLLLILLLPALHMLAAQAVAGMAGDMAGATGCRIAHAEQGCHQGHAMASVPRLPHALQTAHAACGDSRHDAAGCSGVACAAAGCLQACVPGLPVQPGCRIAALPAASPQVPLPSAVFASIYLTPPHRPPSLV